MANPITNAHLKMLLPALFLALTLLTANPVSAQTYTVIHNFTGGPGGQAPYAGVAVDHAGNIYGAPPSQAEKGVAAVISGQVAASSLS